MVDGATTRRLVAARRASVTKTERGLQRIRLARATARPLGLLALATLTTLSATLPPTLATSLALTLRTTTLALGTRRAFTQRTATGIAADTGRAATWTAGTLGSTTRTAF